MDPRNCGFCKPCAEGNYDQCKTFPPKPELKLDCKPKRVYLLETFHRYEEYCPWDVVGFTYSLEKAKTWVNRSTAGYRRYTAVDETEIELKEEE